MLMQEIVGQHEYYLHLNIQIKEQDKKLIQLVEQHPLGALLKSITGVSDMTASLCIANISSATDFKNGRNMAAWLGLVPRQHSTGGNPPYWVSVNGETKRCERFLFKGPERSGHVKA
jgi:transposase